ncbi:MAG: THUMP domain-containing protein, partial [Candidatus Thermoplasmatota archaeon]|nr:THUMP domain-containing protein [Candidatus Thermoplasmatota archaeon]
MVLFIVRYSEIGLKGPKKRSEMERRLITNIRSALDNMDIKITKERGRLFVEALNESDAMRVQELLSHVFGIKSFSKCKKVKFPALDDLIDLSVKEFRDFVKEKKFAVRVRRTGDHDFSSIQVERLLGERLYPFSSGVNLKNPEAEIQMEIRENTAYLYNEIIQGPGGFPIGTQGRMVSLVSGGIDSPVASWMLMKRGCQIDVVFCSLASPIDTLEFLGTVKPLADAWSHGSEMRVHIFDCSPLVDLMIHGQGFPHPNVGFKKFIYEVGEKVAERIGAYG